MALPLAAAFARHLDQLGLGTFDEDGAAAATADVFAGEEPPTPDDVVTVVEIPGGRIPDRFGEERLIQVRVRATSYVAGQQRIQGVFNALHETQGLVGDGTEAGSINAAFVRATTPWAPLGRDSSGNEGGRWRFSATFRVLVKTGFAFAT